MFSLTQALDTALSLCSSQNLWLVSLAGSSLLCHTHPPREPGHSNASGSLFTERLRLYSNYDIEVGLKYKIS